ncbi:DUF4365 domain-containing protein [Methanoplanus limicola]|uniref:DUF4365 domain-containing protein n=1 Tax=Methanoplanus limicola DSM 2279 TaxID=937775 RepID=H1YZH8_9EURY|nr:DUF4365 domain-containing protein [Methanoplanus limicola]EHQ36087.1 hypothetical protein Metlim_1998 [Methanoplanus limicola DSM 2279]
MMNINQQKEQFSRAYVRAVATVAGFSLFEPSVDDDSIDLSIAERGGRGSIRSPRIDLQLKCTSQNLISGDGIRFSLPIKNYNDLRPENVQVPRILLVLVVPDEIERWIDQTEEKLSMYHCGYWESLRGLPDTSNEKNVTVNIPKSQQFTVEELSKIMERVGYGDLP